MERDDLDMFVSSRGELDGSSDIASIMELGSTPTKKSANHRSSMQTLHIPNGHTASSLTLPTIPPPSPDLSVRKSNGAEMAAVSFDRKGSDPLAPLLRMCNLHIQTSRFASLGALHAHLANLELTKEDRMRPGWDRYFMTLAGLASLRYATMIRCASRRPSRKI